MDATGPAHDLDPDGCEQRGAVGAEHRRPRPPRFHRRRARRHQGGHEGAGPMSEPMSEREELDAFLRALEAAGPPAGRTYSSWQWFTRNMPATPPAVGDRVEQVANRTELTAWQRGARRTLTRLMGRLPERVPLNLEVL